MFPQLTWQKQVGEQILYLTFDDGPCPEMTDYVLDLLKQYRAKATFFCVGNNVNKYPEIYTNILENGHATGNHTQHHLDGFATNNTVYYNDIATAANAIESRLFRPPYGKIKTKQVAHLKQHYDIIMWDFITGDFDPKLNIENCKKKMGKYIKAGSIIVFHDSVKAASNLKILLPYLLEKFSKEGYQFHSL